jgi:hypothetical protein
MGGKGKGKGRKKREDKEKGVVRVRDGRKKGRKGSMS